MSKNENLVEYKSELFDLIKDLTPITNQIIFQKDEEGNVVVCRSDIESTIAYRLVAPKSYFDFDDEQIAFYNYPNFYQYLKAFSEPKLLKKNVNTILIQSNTGDATTEYNLTDPSTIKAGPKAINFKDSNIKFKLSSSDLDQFIKMINLIDPKKAQITTDGKKVAIKIFSNLQLHDNTFEKVFEVDEASNIDEEIDFVIFSDTFQKIPLKRDYSVEIKDTGFIKISLLDNDISLDIYTGKVKS